jgi:hypothetical protein
MKPPGFLISNGRGRPLVVAEQPGQPVFKGRFDPELFEIQREIADSETVELLALFTRLNRQSVPAPKTK